jgi:hypothetical protein
MSDEDRTRILKPQKSTGTDEATKIIGRTTTVDQSNGDGGDDEPVTRLVSRQSKPAASEPAQEHELVAGWLVVVSGPGRGCSREIYFGMNSVGRAQDQRIPLDFGDEGISRESHAFIVYDDLQQDFYIQHGGKANLIRLNGKPVLAPMELSHGDQIDIGNTRLMFVPLCSENFDWSDKNDA